MKDEPKVFNLSNRKLTEFEVMLLSKGLKYTPTPNENNQKLKTDIKLYTRRLRLTEYFHDSEEIEADLNSIEQEPKSLVRNNSNFNPKRGRNSTLDAVCDTLENINLSNKTKNVKSNLCKEEEQALKDLREDPTIIIKEADKGGGVVIMNKEYYKDKITHMLQDNNFYRKLDKCHEKQAMTKIKQLVCGPLSRDLISKEKYFLINFENSESQFYGLSKVHKSNEIKKT